MACRDAQSGGDVRFPGSGISVQHKVASFSDELEGFEFGQCGPGFCGEFFAHEVVEIFQLGEGGGPYASALGRYGSAFKFGFKEPGQYGGMRQIVGCGIF